MDLNLLYVFSAVYREKNLSRAAETLGISPAGVSAALRRLRNEFDDILFIRKAHGVEPTVRADFIAEKFKIALEVVGQAKNPDSAFDPQRETRNFIIGISDYTQAVVLPSLLKILRTSAPGVALAFRHTGNASIRRSLDDGVFDLVIGNVISPMGRTRQQNLLTDGFCGIVASTHPLARKEFNIEELNAYPALLTEAHGNERWWEYPGIKSSGYAPSKVTSLPNFMGIARLLLDTPVVCVTTKRLSSLFIQRYPLTAVPLPFDNQPIILRQYWHERFHNDPAHRWLRQSFYNTCQNIEKQQPNA